MNKNINLDFGVVIEVRPRDGAELMPMLMSADGFKDAVEKYSKYKFDVGLDEENKEFDDTGTIVLGKYPIAKIKYGKVYTGEGHANVLPEEDYDNFLMMALVTMPEIDDEIRLAGKKSIVDNDDLTTEEIKETIDFVMNEIVGSGQEDESK